jgi:4-diphosphocytidyl-2-C-methyl-D-erythritol kinase
MISLQAYAKINLTLEVLSKRPDGYHELSSVFQTISLSDTLTFEHSKALDFKCDVSELLTSDNLVPKAARLLQGTTGTSKGAIINLTKKIPIAAGLGSGSTDAAATLVGLNRLWGLNLPFPRLLELAAKLGSDVPFFLYGGTALAQGRGEILTPLPPAPDFWLVLIKPTIEPVPKKTAQLYSRLNPSHFTPGQHTQKLVTHLNHSGKIEGSFLFNVFEQVAFDFFPGLSGYRFLFIKAGARSVHLAGSGPSLFTIVPDKALGEAICNRLENEGLEAHLAQAVKPSNSVPNR